MLVSIPLNLSDLCSGSLQLKKHTFKSFWEISLCDSLMHFYYVNGTSPECRARDISIFSVNYTIKIWFFKWSQDTVIKLISYYVFHFTVNEWCNDVIITAICSWPFLVAMLSKLLGNERARIILQGAATKLRINRFLLKQSEAIQLPTSSEILLNQLKQRNYPHWTAW